MSEKLKAVDKEAEQSMNKAIEALSREFNNIRAGRANPSVLDRVMVEAYGAHCPVNQVANVTVPDGRSITIQPFDRSLISAIERGIMAANLGFNPQNDGNMIRINLPPLTEERRKDLCKDAAHVAEHARVSIRQARKHANDSIKKLEKDEKLPEDLVKRAEDQVQKNTDKFIKNVDALLKKKEAEIMEV
ncbi:MAG: ribosome recycling factor [Candidatus Sumerlaeia bacterium]|nr:ribosome recycling factor [Candidatus Sumerlaeia bacterium]